MKTESRVVIGAFRAQSITLKLLHMSQWFQFEPLPGDEYEITVKSGLEHVLDEPADIEIVEQVATYQGDLEGAAADFGDPTQELHIAANDEHVVIDLGKPGVRWQDGPRLYLERKPGHWRCYIHPDSGDAQSLLNINDDGSIDMEEC